MGLPRTLPLRVDLGDGEALDSWLFRLAHRSGMSFLRLAPVLGFGDRLRVWHNYALTWQLPPPLLRRIETQTGLTAGALDAAVLDRFDALGWKPVPGSRYCPACLTASGGRWPIRWQLPYTFVCTRHRCLLATLCPACRRTPRTRISERSGLVAPTQCTLGTSRHSRACTGDLLLHRPQYLRPGDPRMTAQAWVDDRLDRMDATAVTDLRDLDALAIWFRQRINPAELAHLGAATVTAMREYRDHQHGIKRDQPTATLVTAAMTCQAIDVVTADNHDRPARLAPLLRDAHTQYRHGQVPSSRGPMILSHKRLTSLSEPLQRKVLGSIDAQLAVTERLRYRTRTRSPRAPQPRSTLAADRAEYLPQYLWPDWIIRFRPLRGWHTDAMAIDIPNALLLPGNPVRNVYATAELNPWRNNISIFLTGIAEQHPDVLTALCNLADYLDTHGAPISYRRRRATFTDIELGRTGWDDLCDRADANPGRDTRLLNARRHLFHLLTGADLANRRHPLAFTCADDRVSFLAFQQQMISSLRDELSRHAEHLLAAAGIDEPLTWSPPVACVAGLGLPGREPDDIDMAALHQLVLIDNVGPREAARRLGVCVEHVRYATQRLHRGAPEHATTTRPGSRRLHARAAEVLTVEFFHREHIGAGKDLATLAAETGFSSSMLSSYARRAGIKISNRRVKEPSTDPATASRRRRVKRAPRRDRIDAEWLHEQAGRLRRTNTDIAAELSLSHETVRRYRKHLGIEDRRTGTYDDRRYPQLPADIRRAVEGKRGAWQRLRRFEQVTAYHSINTAAAALGHHAQNLNLQIQRLEADLGTQLLTRGHRYQPITPTRRGQQLLDRLRRPEIRELLDQFAPPDAHQTRGPYKLKDSS